MVNAQQWFDNNYPSWRKGGVEKLDIRNKGLDGSLEINNFPNLKKIDCGGNNLVSLKLYNLPNLAELYACGNQIKELEIWSCWNINRLNIENNKLDNLNFLLHSSISNSKEKLNLLAIGYNNFPSQDLSFLKGYNNLKHLFVKHNNFYGSLKYLENMTKLEELDIENTNIERGLECLPRNSVKIKLLNCEGRNCKKIKEEIKKYSQLESAGYHITEKDGTKVYLKEWYSINSWRNAISFCQLGSNLGDEINSLEQNNSNLQNKINSLESSGIVWRPLQPNFFDFIYFSLFYWGYKKTKKNFRQGKSKKEIQEEARTYLQSKLTKLEKEMKEINSELNILDKHYSWSDDYYDLNSEKLKICRENQEELPKVKTSLEIEKQCNQSQKNLINILQNDLNNKEVDLNELKGELEKEIKNKQNFSQELIRQQLKYIFQQDEFEQLKKEKSHLAFISSDDFSNLKQELIQIKANLSSSEKKIEDLREKEIKKLFDFNSKLKTNDFSQYLGSLNIISEIGETFEKWKNELVGTCLDYKRLQEEKKKRKELLDCLLELEKEKKLTFSQLEDKARLEQELDFWAKQINRLKEKIISANNKILQLQEELEQILEELKRKEEQFEGLKNELVKNNNQRIQELREKEKQLAKIEVEIWVNIQKNPESNGTHPKNNELYPKRDKLKIELETDWKILEKKLNEVAELESKIKVLEEAKKVTQHVYNIGQVIVENGGVANLGVMNNESNELTLGGNHAVNQLETRIEIPTYQDSQ